MVWSNFAPFRARLGPPAGQFRAAVCDLTFSSAIITRRYRVGTWGPKMMALHRGTFRTSVGTLQRRVHEIHALSPTLSRCTQTEPSAIHWHSTDAQPPLQPPTANRQPPLHR